jgi:hypothetical protein
MGTLHSTSQFVVGTEKTTRVLIENGADPFRGSKSPYDVANWLWTNQALEMLKDRIEQAKKLGRSRNKKKMGLRKRSKKRMMRTVIVRVSRNGRIGCSFVRARWSICRLRTRLIGIS